MRRQTTKELLAASFLELAQKKTIDKITITQVANNCGVSQPTFYNHFQDKYDLISWIYTTHSNNIMKNIGQDGYKWKHTLIDGAKYFEENRFFILNALEHTSGQDSFIRNLTAINEEHLMSEVRKKLMTENIPTIIKCYIKIYCHGTVQFMFDWLIGNVRLTSDEVADIWEKSLPEPLKQYLYD